MKDVTITGIAARAGVSHSTVSRVLNNRPGISEAVRERVFQLADEMGYARKSNRQIVGVVIRLDPDGFDQYTAQLLYQLSMALKNAGFRHEIICEHDLDLLDERKLCGVLSLLPLNHIARYWSRYHILPLVCVNDYSDLLGGVRSVCSNDYQGIRQGVEYLAGRGHREIGLVSDRTETLNRNARQMHFLNIMKDYRLKPQIVETFYGDDISSKLEKAPAGLLCCAEIHSEPLFRALCRGNRFANGADLAAWAYADGYWYQGADIGVLSQDFRKLAGNSVAMLQYMLGRKGAECPDTSVDYLFQTFNPDN